MMVYMKAKNFTASVFRLNFLTARRANKKNQMFKPLNCSPSSKETSVILFWEPSALAVYILLLYSFSNDLVITFIINVSSN